MRAAAALLAAGWAGPARACELALALAVDVSGSVGAREYRLQMDGLAAALSDPVVAEALVVGQAAVALIHWGGAARQEVAVSWLRVEDAAALEGLAGAVATARRPAWRSATAVGEAMIFAAGQFAAVPDCGRRVVDISGDGRSNEGRPPAAAGAALEAAGITVNAVAITGSEPFLGEYFAEAVITGPGAFVVTAGGYSGYAEAMRQKLTMEVAPPVGLAPGVGTRRAEARP